MFSFMFDPDSSKIALIGKDDNDQLDMSFFIANRDSLAELEKKEALEADSIDQAKSSLKLWITAEAVCQDGKLDKHEQKRLAVILGKEKAKRLKNFLENLGDMDIIKQTIEMKKARSVQEYEDCSGESANVLVSRIKAEMGQALK